MSFTGSFGWAYVGQGLGGPNGAIQYRNDNGLTGSSAFLYDSATDAVTLSGSLEVSGAITANQFNVNVVEKTVSSIFVTGSTLFGDTTDDTHIFTGSLFLSGASTSNLEYDESLNVVITDPTMIVDGAVVFRGPVQLANVIYGSSPVQFAAEISIVDDEGGEVILGTSGWGGDLEISGTVAATGYVSGSAGIFEELTGTINASNFVGTIDNARLPSIINVSTVTASAGITSPTAIFTSVSGTVIQASQPQITSLGTLESLAISGDLVVDSPTFTIGGDKVGIGRTDPQKTIEVLKADEAQMRLSYSRYILGVSSNVYSDLETQSDGTLKISPSGDKIWLDGATDITGSLVVSGSGKFVGDLEITGTLSANVTNFQVSADSMVFGDDSADSLVFSASNVQTPNGLDFDSGTLYISASNSRVGIGTTSPTTALDVDGAIFVSNLKTIGRDNGTTRKANIQFGDVSPSGNSIISFRDGGNDLMVVDGGGNVGIGTTAPDYKLDVAGTLRATSGASITGSLLAGTLTDGVASLTGGNLTGVTTVTATNLGGTLTTAAQPNITSLGTLTGLSVDGLTSTNGLTVDGTTLFVSSSNDRVGIGKLNPMKTLDIYSTTDTQLRLTNRQPNFPQAEVYTDFLVDNTGDLIITPLGGDVVVSGNLEVSGTVYANELITNVVNKNIVHISATGSTSFGDTSDDTHTFIGSVSLDGALSASSDITSSNLYVVNKVGIGTTSPDASLDVKNNNNLPQVIIRHGPTYKTSLLTTSNGTFRVKPVSRTMEIDTSDANGGNLHFTKNGGATKSGGIAWNTSNLDVTLYSQADLHLGAGGLTEAMFTIDNGGNVGIGTTSPSNKLTVDGAISGSTYYGDGSNLSGLVTTLDDVTDSGNVTTNTITIGGVTSTGDIGITGALSASSAVSASAFFGDGSQLSNLSGETIKLGTAEDGAYSDGLFTDFTGDATTISVAIDRFNEVLKALAPSPGPALDDIDCDDSGDNGKLSFGAAGAISGYTNHGTAAGFSTIDVNGSFNNNVTNGNNLRRGLFAGATTINGDLNEDITADGSYPNYPANSFGNADQGTLNLKVNGAQIHSINLTQAAIGSGVPGSGAGSHLNANGSGFYNLSQTASAHFDDGTELDIFNHRTGKWKVHPDDQRNGWNYAQVVHTINASDTTTNYVEWVNDNNSNALAESNAAFGSISMTGLVTLSGVKYFTGGTALYTVDVANAYRNTYSNSNIQWATTTNCSISSIAMPSIGGGEDETKNLAITGSATIDVPILLAGDIVARAWVFHPLKSNLTTTHRTISNILLYTYSDNSTNTVETFRGESYRLDSGNYVNQSDAVSGNAWTSATSLTTVDGLMFYNLALRSPLQGVNSGNFSTIANGPGSNVNYSSITGTRTFYRKFQNTSGGSKTGFSLTIEGSGTTIVTSGGTLNTTNVKVLIKLPNTSNSQTTGWMDLATAFATGQTGDNDGCLEGSLDNSLDATNVITFGTVYVGDDDWVVVKIEADESWTGYIDSMSTNWT